ncbi:MAG: DUF177 domain-containing protein [Acidobacteriota bacterium]
MLVDINELRGRDEPLVKVQDFAEGELDVANDVSALKRPVHSELRISLSGERLRVEGALTADLELTCARCLQPIEKSVEKNFKLDYRPDPTLEEGEDVSLSYTDLNVGFYRDQQLDVSALISEQVVLEIPMNPVCQEDCKGLCDQCGTNLNEGKCSCETHQMDPRLAILAEFKKKKAKNPER